jgi:ElaB/YqjD/DUF883 family membrane-anchored ribosome-binding protein
MADYNEQKTSAQLEREVAAQRDRVETTINEIQDRLSPGQMVDELLGYAKNNGGADFVANLGRSVSGNPLPVALLGVSLLWLMAKPATAAVTSGASQRSKDSAEADVTWVESDDFGYASVEGPLQRLGHMTDDSGQRYGQFADETGRKFHALADAAGNRAGHFSDEAGSTFRGFRDAAGNRVEDIRDEAGTLLDAATGWASDNWRKAGHAAHNVAGNLADRRDQVQHQAGQAGAAVGQQADQLGRTLMNVLHDQPLVGGALAFAVGAAVASAFPHTRQEDKMFGEAADQLKQQAGELAGDAYDKGKDKATELYGQVADKAADVYQHAKENLTQGLDQSSGAA